MGEPREISRPNCSRCGGEMDEITHIVATWFPTKGSWPTSCAFPTPYSEGPMATNKPIGDSAAPCESAFNSRPK
jgi:hypothetical protein